MAETIYWDLLNKGINKRNYKVYNNIKATQDSLAKMTDEELLEIVNSFKENEEINKLIDSYTFLGEEVDILCTDGCKYKISKINNRPVIKLVGTVKDIKGLDTFTSIADDIFDNIKVDLNYSGFASYVNKFKEVSPRICAEAKKYNFPFLLNMPMEGLFYYKDVENTEVLRYGKVDCFDNRLEKFRNLRELDMPECTEIADKIRLRSNKEAIVKLPKCTYIGKSCHFDCILDAPLCEAIGSTSSLEFKNPELPHLKFVGNQVKVKNDKLEAVNLEHIGLGSLRGIEHVITGDKLQFAGFLSMNSDNMCKNLRNRLYLACVDIKNHPGKYHKKHGGSGKLPYEALPSANFRKIFFDDAGAAVSIFTIFAVYYDSERLNKLRKEMLAFNILDYLEVKSNGVKY